MSENKPIADKASFIDGYFQIKLIRLTFLGAALTDAAEKLQLKVHRGYTDSPDKSSFVGLKGSCCFEILRGSTEEYLVIIPRKSQHFKALHSEKVSPLDISIQSLSIYNKYDKG